MSKRIDTIKHGLILVISLFALYNFIEVEIILVLMEDLSLEILILVIAISLLRPFVGGFRTISAISPFAKISHIDASIGYFISAYGSIFLPSAVGGDILRMEHISRVTSLPRKTILYVIGVERLMGLASLLLIFLSMSLMTKNDLNYNEEIFFLLTIIIIGVTLFLSPFISKFWKKEDGIMGQILEAGGIKTLVPILVVSIVFQSVTFLVPISIALSFGGIDTAVGIALITPIIAIITTLPVSFGGLGVREASYAAMAPLVGIDSEIAFLCGLSLSSSAIFVGLPGPWLQRRVFQTDEVKG